MKFTHKLRYDIGALLCALPLLAASGFACAADEPVAPPTTTAAPAATSIILRDVNEARTIEVESDRNETVAQFFARQKLSLIEKPNTDGKFWSVAETIDKATEKAPLKIFASYPLDNDYGFRANLYGGFYDLVAPTPAVATLFGGEPKLDWSNTVLIIAPARERDPINTAESIPVCIVGRIFVKDRADWRAENEAETLKYRGEEAK